MIVWFPSRATDSMALMKSNGGVIDKEVGALDEPDEVTLKKRTIESHRRQVIEINCRIYQEGSSIKIENGELSAAREGWCSTGGGKKKALNICTGDSLFI